MRVRPKPLLKPVLKSFLPAGLKADNCFNPKSEIETGNLPNNLRHLAGLNFRFRVQAPSRFPPRRLGGEPPGGQERLDYSGGRVRLAP